MEKENDCVITLTINNIEENMIKVKGGKYKSSFYNEEREVFDIEVCKCQTTQDIYENLMGENPSEFKGGRNPVEKVTWWESLEFCNKLSEKANLKPVYSFEKIEIDSSKKYKYVNLKINQLDGEAIEPDKADFRKTEGYRLPTELEWEWFARGGNIAIQNGTFDTKYAGSENIDEVARYDSNSGNKTYAVGTKKANELGLYDCTGNVWEWCYDTADEDNIRVISEKISYIYTKKGRTRRVRGASWYNNINYCKISQQYRYESSLFAKDIGFRIVRTI